MRDITYFVKKKKSNWWLNLWLIQNWKSFGVLIRYMIKIPSDTQLISGFVGSPPLK